MVTIMVIMVIFAFIMVMHMVIMVTLWSSDQLMPQSVHKKAAFSISFPPYTISSQTSRTG
jgi:hypothetical protein